MRKRPGMSYRPRTSDGTGLRTIVSEVVELVDEAHLRVIATDN